MELWEKMVQWRGSGVGLCLVGVLARNFTGDMARGGKKIIYLVGEFVRGGGWSGDGGGGSFLLAIFFCGAGVGRGRIENEGLRGQKPW